MFHYLLMCRAEAGPTMRRKGKGRMDPGSGRGAQSLEVDGWIWKDKNGDEVLCCWVGTLGSSGSGRLHRCFRGTYGLTFHFKVLFPSPLRLHLKSQPTHQRQTSPSTRREEDGGWIGEESWEIEGKLANTPRSEAETREREELEEGGGDRRVVEVVLSGFGCRLSELK